MSASPEFQPVPQPAQRWFGLDLKKNRWIFPAAGLLTTSIRGSAAYTFSLFILPLEQEFGWERSEAVLVFTVYTALYALFMFFGGVVVDVFGPRRPFIVGAILIVASQFLASQAQSHLGLIMTYGVMLGCGVGLASSAATIALSARWYPALRERGTAIGFSVMGIGIGGLIAAPLWHIGVETFGWRKTILITAIVYAALLALVATIIRFPNEQNQSARNTTEFGSDLSLQEALVTRELWTVILLLFLTMFGGLMVVSQIFPFVSEAGAAAGSMGTTIAASAVMAQALCNSIGRPVWGWTSGRLGIRFSNALCAMLMTAGLALLSQIDGGKLEPSAFGVLSLLGIGFIGFAIGGAISISAVACATMFGSDYLARIFGLVFLIGFGGAGLLGPLVGAYLRQSSGDYHISLYIAAALSTLCAIFSLIALPNRGFRRLIGEW